MSLSRAAADAATPGLVNEEIASNGDVHLEYPILSPATGWLKDSLCVFCGSSIGNDPEFKKAADQLGAALAHSNSPLVYGGGTNGLMGAVASATYSSGGRVLGIIPRALMSYERSAAEAGTDELEDKIKRPALADRATEQDRSIVIPVKTMHERKQEMAHYSELGFIALPGGYGTFEEILEMVTWTQLRIHTKPVVLLNINGFYSPLRDFVRGAIKSGFIRQENESFLVFVEPNQSETGDFDWGKAAIQAVREWHKTDKGEAYNLKWESSRAR